MKVLQMNISKSQTNAAVSQWQYVKLFKGDESALEYLNNEYPDHIEITDKVKEEQYWRDDVPRTFKHTKAQYDNEGSYDYPIESEITLEWVEVI